MEREGKEEDEGRKTEQRCGRNWTRKVTFFLFLRIKDISIEHKPEKTHLSQSVWKHLSQHSYWKQPLHQTFFLMFWKQQTDSNMTHCTATGQVSGARWFARFELLSKSLFFTLRTILSYENMQHCKSLQSNCDWYPAHIAEWCGAAIQTYLTSNIQNTIHSWSNNTLHKLVCFEQTSGNSQCCNSLLNSLLRRTQYYTIIAVCHYSL